MTTIAHHADYLCEAVSRLGSESAFEVLARAKAIEAQGRRVVHMEIGEPDFDTPEHIKRAGIEAIEANYSHYTPSAGIPELRDAIADYASRFRGLTPAFGRENVVVGAGAKPIIWNLLSALLDPGDELIYADPAYPAYASAAGYLQAKAVPVHLLESRDWRLDLDELAAKIGPKTKALVINSPHNPTGGVLTREDLETIARLAQEHGFLVISDEIYSRNVYGPRFESIATIDGMRERTIIIDGFSKAYAMTGWRLGYCIAPEAIAKTVTLFNNNTFSCVATFVQRAGIAALTGDDEPVRRMNAIFRERRDAIVGGLNALDGVTCTTPEGAFYAFPNVSRIASDDRHLARWLLEHAGVACLGGSSFGAAGKGYLRFSYAASLDDIAWALEQLREALPRYVP
ncbi:MAG TPA: pyridoxal phosphate-dependent aminotransferase [Candidatus Baltobacteraceae bacterium]|nr:pyridoxal phosphate-dependent aminotransferase [Candidatus Baltobacteraceae bacterium]